MAVPIENFLSPNVVNVLVTLVIPFLLIFAVLLFALKNTRIFGEKSGIYVLLSLGFTLMLYAVNPGNVFGLLVYYLLQAGIAGVVISLVGVTLIIFWALVRRGVGVAAVIGKSYTEKLRDLERREAWLRQRLYREGDFKKRLELDRELDRLQDEMRFVALKMKQRYKNL